MGEQTTNTLFPILQSGPPALQGIAKLAASAEEAGAGHLVRFHALPVKSALNRSVSKRKLWFARTINPYRGCEFACRYCYARYTHEFLNFNDPAAFEREIYIKQNLAWLLEQELRGFDPAEEIAIGTATDPYQPIERTARVTEAVLEVLARQSGLRIGLVTKSTLIERDIALLQRIAERNTLTLHITITTTDRALARKLEPRAPRPDLRFQTVRRLREAGLTVGVLCSPLLPGITDNGPALNLVARAAAEAGASFLSAEPLFLKSCSRDTFFQFIADEFPKLAASYRERYRTDAFVGPAYAARIRAMVATITARHGLAHRTMDAILTREPAGAVPAKSPAQASLWPEQDRTCA
ncbi:radical SAM protein [Acidipila sp. EB88]|nr:radical SAM protein [Acidipila sp. EB88]